MQREFADPREGIVQPAIDGVEDFGESIEFVPVAGAGQGPVEGAFIDATGGLGESGERIAGMPPWRSISPASSSARQAERVRCS
jgi:hypothetical protein